MKTFTKLLIIGILFFAFSAHAQRPAVTGHIEGLGNDSLKIYMAQTITEIENIDDEGARVFFEFSIYAENGKFILDTIGNYPVVLTLMPHSLIAHTNGIRQMGAKRIDLTLAPGEYAEIKGVINNKSLDYDITGTDMNRDLSLLYRLRLPSQIKIDSLNLLIEKDNTAADLLEQRAKLIEENEKYLYDHVNNNTDAVSAGVVALQLPLDSIGIYYAKLGEAARTNVFAEKFLKYYLKLNHHYSEERRKTKEAKSHIVAGADAPRFTLKCSDGGQVSLTDVKDKYIVLDFWGSWCGPCMAGVPRMKKYYEEYKDKVELIGISCNDTEKKWLETVAKENLPWINLIEDPKDRTSVQYAVEAYPTKIILDRDFRIVEVFRGEGDDFYAKLDELLK